MPGKKSSGSVVVQAASVIHGNGSNALAGNPGSKSSQLMRPTPFVPPRTTPTNTNGTTVCHDPNVFAGCTRNEGTQTHENWGSRFLLWVCFGDDDRFGFVVESGDLHLIQTVDVLHLLLIRLQRTAQVG